MTKNGTDSDKFDLFDELETGSNVSPEILSQLEGENPELANILKKSNILRTTGKVKPDPFYARVSQIRVYYKLIESLSPKPSLSERIQYFFSNIHYPALPSLSLKPVLIILFTLIFTFSFFVGGVQAADNSRPGQFLYPVDRTLENVQLFLTFNEESRLRLRLNIAEERLEEARIEYQEGDVENAEIALAGFEEVQTSITSQIENNHRDISQEMQITAIEAGKTNREVLNNLLVSVPETSQGPIIHAIELSQELIDKPPIVQEPPAIETTPAPDLEPTPELEPQPTLMGGEPVFVRVWVHSVNVHSDPGLEAPVIGWLFQNQTFIVNTCQNNFVYIPEFSGWVSGTCFDPNPCGPAGTCLEIWD